MKETTAKKEYGVLDPVPQSDRHFSFGDMMLTWMGANFQPGAWTVGGTIASAGFLGAMAIVLIGNPITYIILALVGFISYKIGVPTMMVVRASMGVRGGYVAVICNIFSIMGWTAISNYFASITISYIFNTMFGTPAYGSPGAEPWMLVGCCINAVIAFIAVYAGGSRSLKIFERIMMLALLVLAVFISIKLFQMVTIRELLDWVIPADRKIGFGVGLDAMIAFGITWTLMSGDYTRYTKDAKSATLAPILGASIAAIWFAVIGVISVATVALTTGVFDANNANPSSLLMGLGFSWIALIVVVFSSVTTSMVNIFSGSIQIMCLSKKLQQKHVNIFVAVFTTLLAFVPVFHGSFADLFMVFLDSQSAMFPPIMAIMIMDYYFVKKRSYDVSQLNEENGSYWYTKGFNIAAILSWVIGTVIYVVLKGIGFGAETMGAVVPSFVICCVSYLLLIRCIPAAKKAESN
ncbi:MAG: cytosine permease [Oscillospiraceae bacterium]|nr:cytosine permease [Oscillospiraceae bacterium]